MIRFHLLGIPVQVQPFFWLTLALIGGAITARTAEQILNLGLFLLAGFLSVLLHELGHAWTARRFGAWSEIILHAFGGVAPYSGPRMTRKQSFLITAAGPFVQLVLGGLALALLMSPQAAAMRPPVASFFFSLASISIFWAILNLLPVYPLDGGQMLHAVLGPRRIRTTLIVTILVATSAAVFLYLSTGSFLFPLFLGLFAWRAWQSMRDGILP